MRKSDRDKNIAIQIFDDDIGKDDFLGEFTYDARNIVENGGMKLKESLPLENCKTGNITVSMKYVPKKDMSQKIGDLSLIVHSAANLEKKNKLKKADPYVVCSLGESKFKSSTVKNSSKPVWEHKAQFEINHMTPLTLSIEVFDDDIGKDAAIGDISIDLAELMSNCKVEAKARLENCKTGDLVFSAFFVPSHQEEEKTVSTKQIFNAREGQKITMMTPKFVGNNYLVIETGNISSQWFLVILHFLHNLCLISHFQVVSALKDLPVEMNIVPFMKMCPSKLPQIHLKCLPAGGFHHIKRVVHSGKGLRKCGYEKLCVMKNNESYDFYTNDEKSKVTGPSKLIAETWGPNDWAIIIDFDERKDFITAIMKDIHGDQQQLVVSFYDSVIEAA